MSVPQLSKIPLFIIDNVAHEYKSQINILKKTKIQLNSHHNPNQHGSYEILPKNNQILHPKKLLIIIS